MASSGVTSRHVLVVDDDGALRHAIAALLDQAGFRTEQAADGPEALRKLQQPVDLLLLDIGLPGISGLDVLAQSRSQAHPPRVVMMTADDTPETLAARILIEEHRAYPEAVALVLEGGWRVEGRRFVAAATRAPR